MPINFLLKLIIIFNLIFFMKVLGKFKNKKENYVIMILIVSCLALDIRMDLNFDILYEAQYPYIALTLILVFIITIIELRNSNWKLKLDNWIMLMFILLLLIQSIRKIPLNIGRAITLYSLYLGIFCIGIMYKNFKNFNYNRVLKCISYIAIFNGILGILQFITSKKLLYGRFNNSIFFTTETGAIVKRVVGIAETNNSGGNLGFILFTVVLFNYIRSHKKIDAIALVLTSIFSILTLTRIGYLAIGISIFIFFIFTRWNTFKVFFKKVTIFFSGIFIGIIILFFLGKEINNILFEQRGDTQNARTIQFEYAYNNIIKNNNYLSGIGTGQYRNYVYNNLAYKDLDMHSEYINILVENGLIAFIIFLILNITIIILAFKNCDNKLEKSFVISLFIGNLICSNYNPNQYYVINNIYYYLLIYLMIYKKNTINNKVEFTNDILI